MSRRILIVEDDEVQKFTLQAALERAGYAVDTAGDGIESVKKLCAEPYALALIDYQIPEIDGLTSVKLATELRGDIKRPRLLAVTASPDTLQEKLCGTNPFDLIIRKPYQLADIIAAVELHAPLLPRTLKHEPARSDAPRTGEGETPRRDGTVLRRHSAGFGLNAPAITLKRYATYLRSNGRQLMVMKFEGAYVHYVADDNGNFRTWDTRCWRVEQKSMLLATIVRQTS